VLVPIAIAKAILLSVASAFAIFANSFANNPSQFLAAVTLLTPAVVVVNMLPLVRRMAKIVVRKRLMKHIPKASPKVQRYALLL
jgi:hypothetical protein